MSPINAGIQSIDPSFDWAEHSGATSVAGLATGLAFCCYAFYLEFAFRLNVSNTTRSYFVYLELAVFLYGSRHRCKSFRNENQEQVIPSLCGSLLEGQSHKPPGFTSLYAP